MTWIWNWVLKTFSTFCFSRMSITPFTFDIDLLLNHCFYQFSCDSNQKLTSVSPNICSVRSPLSNDNVGTFVCSSSFLIKWSWTLDPPTWRSRSYDCGWKLLSVDLLVRLPSVTPTLMFAMKQCNYYELFINFKLQIKRTRNKTVDCHGQTYHKVCK